MEFQEGDIVEYTGDNKVLLRSLGVVTRGGPDDHTRQVIVKWISTPQLTPSEAQDWLSGYSAAANNLTLIHRPSAGE